MQLPFTVVLDSANRDQIVRAVRHPGLWLCVAALLALVTFAAVSPWRWSETHHRADAGTAPLDIASEPAGATVLVDGIERGRTPTTVPVGPGWQSVLLRLDGWLDARTQVDPERAEGVLRVQLWPRNTSAIRLHPTYPGATVASARFLADGRVALAVAIPPTDERQAWVFDPPTSAWERVGPIDVRTGPIAASPNGERVAYLTSSARPSGARSAIAETDRFDELWLAGKSDRGERRFRLPAEAGAERLIDLSWSPDGEHLLLASRQQVAGGARRTRLMWLRADGGGPQELVVLPSDIVAGSYHWSPRGDQVAFLARPTNGTLVALCLADGRGAFRYLADVSRGDLTAPLPFPPLAWSTDGRQLLYAAPPPERRRAAHGLWPFVHAKPALALFRADSTNPVGAEIGDRMGVTAPAWRLDGSVLALARPSPNDGRLVLRGVGLATGRTDDLLALPLKTGATYAARWDVAHAQALVVTRQEAGGLGGAAPEFWLLRFGTEAPR